MESNIKKGLIMEGGAMRGMFTCGVLDVFMENGINFDGAAGISAGAVFGCNIKSKQIGRGIRYNKKYCNDKRFCGFRSLLKTGDFYNVEFCYNELPNKVDIFDKETFKNNPMEFYVGATNVNTGEEEYHKCIDGGELDTQWFRASASMPLVSRVVEIDGNYYLDGGMVVSVPYQYMEDIGYNRNVIILTQPEGFVKEKSSLLPLISLCLKKYPKVIEAMKVRHEMYNEEMKEIKEREGKGLAYVIRPPQSLGIKRTEDNPDELERVYQIGRAEAERCLDNVKKFLENGEV